MAVFSEKVDNSNTFSNVVIIMVVLILAIISWFNRLNIIKFFGKIFVK